MLVTFEGDTSSTGLEATIREVMGDTRVAFVALGSATLLTAADLGFAMPFAIRLGPLTIFEVGVTGTAADLLGRARFLVGVDGPVVSADGISVVAAFLLLAVALIVGVGRDTGAMSSACATSLADRRVVISGAMENFAQLLGVGRLFRRFLETEYLP